MNESPADILMNKDSLFTEENNIPNENWSQFKRSNEAEGFESSVLNNAHCDIEMVDETENESECWNGGQTYGNNNCN